MTCTLIFVFWLNSKKSANICQKHCLDPYWREFYRNADSKYYLYYITSRKKWIIFMNNIWSIFYDTEFKIIIKKLARLYSLFPKKHPSICIWYETLKCGLSHCPCTQELKKIWQHSNYERKFFFFSHQNPPFCIWSKTLDCTTFIINIDLTLECECGGLLCMQQYGGERWF